MNWGWGYEKSIYLGIWPNFLPEIWIFINQLRVGSLTITPLVQTWSLTNTQHTLYLHLYSKNTLLKNKIQTTSRVVDDFLFSTTIKNNT